VPVPFLDLKATYLELSRELDEAYHRVMDSGWYLLGRELEAFESEFAAYCGSDYAVGVGNGLEALELLLRAYEIGPGDEVIVPSNTYVATWLAVSHVGATPIPVEPRHATCNLDPELIEAAITPKTRAILPVHLYGQTVEMEPVMALAAEHGLVAIEDAAQAHGARYHGRRAGSLGAAAGFSFYPSKNLGAFGDGGAVTADDPEIIRKVKLWRNYGSEKKYVNEVPGVNSRLDEVQAAYLRVKLTKLDEWNKRRGVIATQYLDAFSGLESLALPEVCKGAEPVWHVFAIRHANRDQLRQTLKEKGIQTIIHYPIPPHHQRAYSSMSSLKLPIAERIHQQTLSLPIGPHLSQSSVEAVIDAVLEACR
jgi:dTDP-4-amino-4,6-dideoxygalactose transaminase